MSGTAAMLAGSPPPGGEWSASPLAPALADEARRLIARLDARQRLWLSGYLAGTCTQATADEAAGAASAAPAVTVLFGSQTGNAERLAGEVAQTLRQRGVPCTVLDMLDCRVQELQAAKILLVIVSTQGEGDPPDRAVALWELLNSRKAPKLSHLKYAVLGLGDSTYQNFCEMGRRFDARLEALGAERLHARADCDVDFEAPAHAWLEAVFGKLEAANVAAPSAPRISLAEHAPASVSNAYTRRNPFHAPVLTNQRLTVTGSTKDVRHIELALSGSGIRYEPGDAIGVVPRNDTSRVEELLEALPFDPESPITRDSQTIPLRKALQENYEIGPLDRTFVERYATAVDDEALRERLAKSDESELDAFLAKRELVDLVREYPPRGLDAGAFAQVLRPLAPRLYSIASSLHATPDEVHLTVGVIEYDSTRGKRRGVVSGMLAQLTDEDAEVPVYLHRNSGFRLPAPDVPIIMIGPGTGVAPFRAFVAERAASGARGRNWLFFGDRCFETDFLYQAEWLAWRKQGVLTRIDVAFSRDQAEKIYVQHRLLEHGAEVWAWLNEGAHVYVCGDAKRMAPDVHRTLLQIAQQHGALSDEAAVEYYVQLQRERRYQRDVY